MVGCCGFCTTEHTWFGKDFSLLVLYTTKRTVVFEKSFSHVHLDTTRSVFEEFPEVSKQTMGHDLAIQT